MSYTLDNLREAEAAIDRGDYEEAKSRVKYLRQRMETLLEKRKHYTEIAKEQSNGNNRNTQETSG